MVKNNLMMVTNIVIEEETKMNPQVSDDSFPLQLLCRYLPFSFPFELYVHLN